MSITIGIGKNLKVAPSPTPTANEPEVDAYILGLTTELSAEQIARLNIFVYCLKNGLGISALSDVFDCLWILAGETEESSLRNLIKRDHDCTKGNNPLWIQYEGFTGDLVNRYLDTNFTDGDGINYDVSSYNYLMGCYTRSGSYGAYSIIGARNDATIYAYIRNSNLNEVIYYPHAAQEGATLNNTSYPRILSMGRNSDANNSFGYLKNKTEDGSASDASIFDSIMTYDYYIGAANNRDLGPVLPFDGQQSMAFFSRFLSNAEHNTLWDCFLAYMNANGKDS